MYFVYVTRPTIQYTNKYHRFHQAISSKFIGFSQNATTVRLDYNAPLSESEQANIQTQDVSFVDNDPLEYVLVNILIPARTFGLQTMNEFAAENVLLGITAANKTNHVRKTMKEVTDCLITGSLYDAIFEARQVPDAAKDAVFITNARLLTFINKIEKYLGLPLSLSL